MERTKVGLAVTGLVLGVIGLVFSIIPIVNNLAFFIGIIAVVFGVIALITKNKKGLSIAGIVCGVLAIVITLVLQASWSKALDDATDELNDNMDEISENLDNATGENTEQLLGTAVNVDLGTISISTDEYGFVTSSLPVTVTNISSETSSFSITVEAVNADGSRLATDYVYADSLASNQSMTSEVFTYISSDEVEAYQNATFQVLEVSMY